MKEYEISNNDKVIGKVKTYDNKSDFKNTIIESNSGLSYNIKADDIEQTYEIEYIIDNVDDLYFSVSTLRYLPSTIINKLGIQKETKKILPKLHKNSNKTGVIVSGSTDLLTTLASCCNPVYGEDIVGYITKGYGVKIHSRNCKNIDLNSERIIDAQWEDNVSSKYTVKIKVYIEDVKNILLDIASSASKYDITLESMTLINRNNELFYDVSCKVINYDKLNMFIDELKNIPLINKVIRVFV